MFWCTNIRILFENSLVSRRYSEQNRLKQTELKMVTPFFSFITDQASSWRWCFVSKNSIKSKIESNNKLATVTECYSRFARVYLFFGLHLRKKGGAIMHTFESHGTCALNHNIVPCGKPLRIRNNVTLLKMRTISLIWIPLEESKKREKPANK